MAWAGKILRVNLTKGTVTTEPLNREWARDFVGSRGLGSKYLINEIDPKVDPLSPEQQDHLGHRPAHGDHGVHRGTLHRYHQRAADGRHCLFQLGWLLGRRASRWPAGTW